jgi:hypothetical protein
MVWHTKSINELKEMEKMGSFKNEQIRVKAVTSNRKEFDIGFDNFSEMVKECKSYLRVLKETPHASFTIAFFRIKFI